MVALESTVFSRLGLPSPANADALERSLRAVQAAGAVPAVTAVVDGVACVGLDDAGLERVLGADRKAGGRDLPVALAQRWPVAATTVSASVALAARAGIAVFATGGIGGVHRDFAATGDVSADLGAIARHPVATVCAGAKSFLDLPRTLEVLEALGVPVLGLGSDQFPAFHHRASGLPVPHPVGSPEEAAKVVAAGRSVGYGGGVVVAVPVPAEHELPREVVDAAVESALAETGAAGVSGGAVTPFVLERIAAATGGRSVATNVAVIENNASVAGAVASARAAS